MSKKILLVDDDAVVLKSLHRELEYSGFAVATASSGEEALLTIHCNPVDLVVTDLSMPGLDGIGVLEGVKKNNPETMVIILTGYGDFASAIEALQLGADDYLLKPCDTEELLLRVDRCLEKQDAFRKIKLFSYSISHDLKNPAIALHGLTNLLVRKYQKTLPEKGKLYCEQIKQTAEQIATLVEQINFYISTTEQPISIETFNPKEIFQAVMKEYENQLIDREIMFYKPASFSDIKADKLCITRIFRNLIGNALKYGGEQLSEIKVTCDELENHHKFSVTNNGNPLDQEDCKTLFGCFKRKNKSTGATGAGLGLAIVREIAELHGGEATANSNGEKGVTFHFTISKSL